MGRDAMGCLLDDIQYGKIVMTIDRKVVGYLVYGWRRLSFVVIRFGVLPAFRRRRIGRTAFRWLAGAARAGGRTMIEVWVPDWAVDAQVFLVRHRYVGVSDGDQIVFRIGLHGK
jgi:GNAT superfamily N-acetyltransferase